MPKNNKYILCFDFETDSPNVDTCNAVELAAVPIHPETLEILSSEAFSITIRPPNIDKEERLEKNETTGELVVVQEEYWTNDRKKTLQWHAEQRKVPEETIAHNWRHGVDEKIAWQTFIQYCKKYNSVKKRGDWYPQPIPMGYNINNFDIPLVKRLCTKYGTENPFSEIFSLDIMQNLWWWFSDLDEPERYRLDDVRAFLGLAAHSQAHEALSDVIDEAKIGVKFLKFHRRQASVDKFKNSFGK